MRERESVMIRRLISTVHDIARDDDRTVDSPTSATAPANHRQHSGLRRRLGNESTKSQPTTGTPQRVCHTDHHGGSGFFHRLKHRVVGWCRGESLTRRVCHIPGALSVVQIREEETYAWYIPSPLSSSDPRAWYSLWTVGRAYWVSHDSLRFWRSQGGDTELESLPHPRKAAGMFARIGCCVASRPHLLRKPRRW